MQPFRQRGNLAAAANGSLTEYWARHLLPGGYAIFQRKPNREPYAS